MRNGSEKSLSAEGESSSTDIVAKRSTSGHEDVKSLVTVISIETIRNTELYEQSSHTSS